RHRRRAVGFLQSARAAARYHGRMEPLTHTQSIEIAAPAARVWRVLTDPEITPEYMYGCRAETDWKVGSALAWRGVADGVVYVKGAVVAVEPERLLAYTVIGVGAASMGVEDRPENYLTMTCRLSPRGAGTLLEITSGDYAVVQNGQARYAHTVSESANGNPL